MRKRNLWIALGLVLLATLAIAAWPSPDSSNPDAVEQTRAQKLAREIRCPTCAGLSVAESDAPLAMSSRAEIESQLEAGRTDQEIRDFFIARYGESALVTAEKKGAGLLPWLLVPAIGLMALAIVVFTVRKWRSQQSETLAQGIAEGLAEETAEDRAAILTTSPRSKAPKFKASKTQQRVVWAIVLGFASVITIVGVVSSSTQAEKDTQQRVAELLERAGTQTSEQRPADAVRTYDRVLAIDPDNVQALTYKGWLIRLAGMGDEGLKWVDQAIEVDPNYPDARFFKGLILLRDQNNPEGAVTEFDAFLALNPPSEMADAVRQARDEALNKANAKTSSTAAQAG